MPIRDSKLYKAYKRPCELGEWIHCCYGNSIIQRHHIMRGIWRHDAVWNLICVCQKGHDMLHDVKRFSWQETQIVCWRAKLYLGEFYHQSIGDNFRCSVRDYIEESIRKKLIGERFLNAAFELLKECER